MVIAGGQGGGRGQALRRSRAGGRARLRPCPGRSSGEHGRAGPGGVLAALPAGLLALLAGLLALAPGLAVAQGLRDLDGEQSALRSFSGRVGDGPVRFSVTVPAASAMQIDVLATSALDPVLRVYDATGEALLIENDDEGDGLNSRAVIRAEQARRIVIEVSSAVHDGFAGEASLAAGGSFDLHLTTRPYEAQPRREIGWGARESGTLAAGEEHLFRLRGEEGALLQAALLAGDEATGFDPYLELRDAAGITLASDDDSGGGLNALLRQVFEKDAEYTLVVASYGQSAGDYVLRIAERRPLLAQAPEQVIGLGETVTGRLGLGYESLGAQPGSITYRLDPAALARIAEGPPAISFRLQATGEADADFGPPLDPFLELGFATPLGFAVVASDDDGGGGFDALLPVDLAPLRREPGLLERLRIRVSGVGAGEGAYALSALPGLAAPAAAKDGAQDGAEAGASQGG